MRKRAKDVTRGEMSVLLVEKDRMFNLPFFLMPEVEGLCLEKGVVEAQHICITIATTLELAHSW
jgi:hypothetical protein